MNGFVLRLRNPAPPPWRFVATEGSNEGFWWSESPSDAMLFATRHDAQAWIDARSALADYAEIEIVPESALKESEALR